MQQEISQQWVQRRDDFPDTSDLAGKIFSYNVVCNLMESASRSLTTFQTRLPAVMPLREVIQVLERVYEQTYLQTWDAQALLQIAILKTADGQERLNYNFPVGHYFPDNSVIVAVAEASDFVPPQPLLEEEEKLSVTVITGFLGSGKTTLMNYILTADHKKKLMVIQNEFGSVDIDGALVQAKLETAEDIQVLDNGCMCCTVRGDLVVALNNILDKCKESQSLIDGVLIETTGMADPAPIIAVFNNPSISKLMRLDSILTVVDVNRISEQLDRPIEGDANINEAVQQVICADRILLNKADKATAEQMKAAREKIKTINKFAKMTPTTYGQVNLDKILNVQAFSLKQIGMEDILFEEVDCADEGCTDPTHNHDHDHHDHDHKKHDHDHDHKKHDHDHDHKKHDHDHDHKKDEHHHEHEHKKDGHHHHGHKHEHSSGVSSVGIQKKGEVELGRFQYFIQSFIQKKVKDIYRLKGILALHGKENKFVIHGIHEDIMGEFTEPWGENEERVCKMVFIGKDLDKETLKADFGQCFVVQKRKAEAVPVDEQQPHKKQRIEAATN